MPLFFRLDEHLDGFHLEIREVGCFRPRGFGKGGHGISGLQPRKELGAWGLGEEEESEG